MNVKKIWSTENGESIIAYCARVSSNNQENPNYEKLIEYCYKNKHFSIFEMANFCVEINTTRAISQQIIRHKSFSFQEFSQRYASVENISDDMFEMIIPRRQDYKNRQNSFNDLSEETIEWFKEQQKEFYNRSIELYKTALEKNIAKESARFILPLSTKTKLYMNGNIRSWIHYFISRLDASTQMEHRIIAQAIFDVFSPEYPIISNLIKTEM